MNDESGPFAGDREFFSTLSVSRVGDLDRIVADDFILIKLKGGTEVTKASLVAAEA